MSTTATYPLSSATLPSPWRLTAVGVGFSLLWSSAFIAGKVGLAVSGPLTLLALRFTLAGLLLLGWMTLSGRPVGRPRDLAAAVGAGLLSNAVYLGLAYLGLKHLPAALTAIIVSTTPLLTTAAGAIWQREAFGLRRSLGLALAFGAVVLIMSQRLRLGGTPLGPVLLIGAGTLALVVGTLLNRHVAGRNDPWTVATWQLLAAGLALLPVAAAVEGLHFVAGTAFFSSLLYQAGPVSIGTTLALLWLVKHGGASKGSSFHLLSPFFSTGLAVALLGETLLPFDLIGLIPLVLGMALVLRR